MFGRKVTALIKAPLQTEVERINTALTNLQADRAAIVKEAEEGKRISTRAAEAYLAGDKDAAALTDQANRLRETTQKRLDGVDALIAAMQAKLADAQRRERETQAQSVAEQMERLLGDLEGECRHLDELIRDIGASLKTCIDLLDKLQAVAPHIDRGGMYTALTSALVEQLGFATDNVVGNAIGAASRTELNLHRQARGHAARNPVQSVEETARRLGDHVMRDAA